MLRRAQILFSDTLHDCFVVDSSEGGARIQTASPVTVPGSVLLRYDDGHAVNARRAWSRGTEIGLAFIPGAAGSDTALRIAEIGEVLADGRFDAAVRDIRTARFFDDDAIRDATETAETARLRLAGALRKAARDAAAY